MSGPWARLAGAPITWGVCEVTGWGHQLPPERVLSDMQLLGLHATELGPDGFLPSDGTALRSLLATFELRLIAGFVPIVLHRPEYLPQSLAIVETQARRLAAGGADILVVAASSGADGYDGATALEHAAWPVLCEGLSRVEEIAARHGLRAALHPHHGTAVERAAEVWQLLERSRIGLCVDTGHLFVGGVDPLELTTAAANRVVHVHLKDVDARAAEQVRDGTVAYRHAVADGLYRPLGRGAVDVDGVIRQLESNGYAGWYVLEQDTVLTEPPGPEDDPYWAAEASVRYLQTLAGGPPGPSVEAPGRPPIADATKDPR